MIGAETPGFSSGRSAVWGRSGNGAYVLVRSLDYPNDAEHVQLIKSTLDMLAERYGRKGRDDAFVDTGPGHPCAHVGIPGTLKCKGVSTPDRPHRMVTVDGGGCPCGGLDLRAFLATHFPAGPPKPRAGGAGAPPHPPGSTRKGVAIIAAIKSKIYHMIILSIMTAIRPRASPGSSSGRTTPAGWRGPRTCTSARCGW